MQEYLVACPLLSYDDLTGVVGTWSPLLHNQKHAVSVQHWIESEDSRLLATCFSNATQMQLWVGSLESSRISHRCGSVGWALSCKVGGHCLDSRSGHTLRLKAGVPTRGNRSIHIHVSVPVLLSSVFSLSLKKKNKKTPKNPHRFCHQLTWSWNVSWLLGLLGRSTTL